MRLRVSLLMVGLFLSATGGLEAEVPRGVNLARLGGWDIVVADDAGPSVRYAAEEFQRHFEKASGLLLRVVSEVDRPDRHVFVGPGEAMRRSPTGFDCEDFGPEDLRIVIRDDTIVIAGGQPRGTLYGVYTFLEDYVGVRFLTARHTHVPPVGPWKIVGPVDRFYHPPLAMRWSYYGETNRNPEFAARLRVNTVTSAARLGGKSGISLVNHSFHRQIPSAKYGAEHPEYYCLIDGKRRSRVKSDSYENEPCLTNPDVRRIITEAVLAEIEHHPASENVSVSQNDNDKYCRCETCSAIDEREGTPMGSLLTLVNSVADEVAKKYPAVDVGTLSYWYTRQPPKHLRPRPNVQIQLCSIECCLIHSIDAPDCPRNVRFCEDLKNWGAICDNISIWNYNTNFRNYLLPCPNLRVIEPNVRFFVANQARGIFMQAAGNALSAELSDLRNYMMGHLIWNPNRSGAQLMDEFLRLHYGSAAPPIRRYIDLIHDTAQASGVHRNCFARRATEYGIDASVAPKALALFDEALRLAETEEVRGRVEKASITAYRLAIEPVWDVKDASGLDSDVLTRMRPLVARFLELCARYDVDRASEHDAFSAARERLEKLVKGSPVVMTVRGPIAPEDLGRTLAHEHVLCDFIGAAKTGPHRYDSGEVLATMEPYLRDVKKSGFAAFVDATPAYIGRDPAILRELSRLTGLHVLTNTGYYGAAGDKYIPAHARSESSEQLAERWITEWQGGIAGTGIRPGFIKIGVDPGPLSPIDRKLVEAAALTHLETGLTIACHTGEGQAALEVLSVIEKAGLDPAALIVVHADGIQPEATHLQLAARGAWVEYDGVGSRPTAKHVALVRSMLAAGHGNRLLLSHDAGWYRVGEPDGKIRPYNALSDELLPALRKAGVSEETITKILEENPRRAFAVSVRKR